MDGGTGHGLLLAAVDVLGTVGAFRPGEAEAPPVVDADRVLAGAVALQGLEPVTRQPPQLAQAGGRLEGAEPPLGLPSERFERGDALTGRAPRRAAIAEAADHRRP